MSKQPKRLFMFDIEIVDSVFPVRVKYPEQLTVNEQAALSYFLQVLYPQKVCMISSGYSPEERMQ